jgi:hypothetical protein
MGAGRPEPGPGQLQERLGGGRETSDRCRLRRRLQKLAGALQKVRPPRRRVRRKILINKHPPSSNCCQFIYRFAFVCIKTSYVVTFSVPGNSVVLIRIGSGSESLRNGSGKILRVRIRNTALQKAYFIFYFVLQFYNVMLITVMKQL